MKLNSSFAMFCLMYFLPMLVLAPLPFTSPLLNLSIIVSMIIQNRPCIYCSVMLLALCACSCQIAYFSYLTGPVVADDGHDGGDQLDVIQRLWMILMDSISMNFSSNGVGFVSRLMRECVRPRESGFCWLDWSSLFSLSEMSQPRRI